MKPSHFAFVCLATFCLRAAAPFSAAQIAFAPPMFDAVLASADPAAQPSPAPSTDQNNGVSSGASSPAQSSTPPPPNAGDAKSDNTKSTGKSDATAGGTSKDRLFFALPNFLTVENAGSLPPLTAGQKYKVVAQGAFDPIQFVWYGLLSGISQAQDSEPGFGQGWEAYGKRYGAYVADGTIENFMVGAIFPSILHQDPRFFPMGHGTFTHRAEHAVGRIFITPTDSKKKQFNYSEIVGSALASAISTYSYHSHPGYHVGEPYIASDRTLTNTASVWGTQVGYDTMTLVIKEFWPDIRRKMSKKKH